MKLMAHLTVAAAAAAFLAATAVAPRLALQMFHSVAAAADMHYALLLLTAAVAAGMQSPCLAVIVDTLCSVLEASDLASLSIRHCC